ncbi:hypothetical protein BDW22DRAFT_66332 [Trametopsis cervina]|nr:hypothetical protein BDW22DRAFT_66332 [Trametopsis cervina]
MPAARGDLTIYTQTHASSQSYRQPRCRDRDCSRTRLAICKRAVMISSALTAHDQPSILTALCVTLRIACIHSIHALHLHQRSIIILSAAYYLNSEFSLSTRAKRDRALLDMIIIGCRGERRGVFVVRPGSEHVGCGEDGWGVAERGLGVKRTNSELAATAAAPQLGTVRNKIAWLVY